MAKKVENTPSPSVLMTSMRSIGYNFKTAIADIIDNSISAGANNIYITSPINEDELFISILDDGDGMSDTDLLNAMKYGSDKAEYGSHELGRFGLGLKSASLSQCRILTVASRFNDKIHAYQWNLDRVIEENQWICLKLNSNEIQALPHIDSLRSLNHGTLVIWQNFDIALKQSGGSVREYISNKIDDAELHIRLVFHRFLNKRFNPLKIYINNNSLTGLDPFLEKHPKTDTKDPSEVTIDGSKITVQPFILPHQTDLSDEDVKKLGGVESFRDAQGFYVYRNERLIVYGTWFRLSKSNISNELYKYGRIKVDIPNTLDDTCEIDIKKQNAVIPSKVLNYLKKIVRDVCGRSQGKTAKRAKLILGRDDSKIWNKMLSPNQKDLFYINTDSEFVKNFIDEFDDNDRAKIIRFIDIICSSMPVDDIYNSICNKNNETKMTEDLISTYITEGIHQVQIIKRKTCQSYTQILDKMSKYEPFNNEDVMCAIRERVLK